MTNETLLISNNKKILHLNNDVINFKLNFKVVGESPFFAVICDQDQLDNGNIEFKSIDDGFFSGEMVSNNNIHKNYFIVLRADNDVNVSINLDLQELPINNDNKTDILENYSLFDKTKLLKILLGVTLTIIILLLLYNFYKKQMNMDNIGNSNKSLLNKFENIDFN